MKMSHWGPAVLGLAALLVSAAIMGGLLTFKRAPAEATVSSAEAPVHVEAVAVQPRDVPVVIDGFGEVAALRMVTITPEVSGQVVSVHPALVAGGQIPAGDVLFTIDPRPYEARLADAEAQVARQENTLLRLRREEEHRQADLKDLARKVELAANDHARATKLFDEGVGSKAAVDQAEQTLVTMQNERDQLARNLALYPIRIGEAESDLKSAEAKQKLAQVDLEHTRVTAPFAGRVKREQIEAGEVINAGSEALTLVDDSILEIAVPLNSRDARQWLKFDDADAHDRGAWFGPLAPVTCTIRWTEGEAGHHWEGTLDRVESYDEDSRTLTVVVRVEGSQRAASGGRFPLVAGMFCSVAIPGREMQGVYRLPSHAVSFEDTVFIADGNRLKTVPVTVSRLEAAYAYVSDGLNPGDHVITTRLVNPLDHTLLAVKELPPETVE